MDGMKRLAEKIDEFRENLIVTDAIEVLGPLGEVNEFITKISKFSNDLKLSCAWTCIAKDSNIEQSINEIYNYVSDKERAFFISNEFRKILLSNSIRVSCIRALVLGKVVRENRACSHQELIILQVLERLTDIDLNNYIELLEYEIKKKENEDIIDESELPKEKAESYKYTLQILYTNGLLELKTSLVDGEDFFIGGRFFVVSEITRSLLPYIEEIKQVLPYSST